MKKIPTIFKRKPDKMSEILNEPHPDCDWVFKGEGVATRKYDGTCVKIENGRYFKRREVKKGKKIPPDFVEEMTDINTGKKVGWVPVNPDSKEDKWHMVALKEFLPNGTYELLGPKIQGNIEKFDEHILIKHSDAEKMENCPRDYNGIQDFMLGKDIEGIVFHHPDGRMGKIKKRDYGMKRNITRR